MDVRRGNPPPPCPPPPRRSNIPVRVGPNAQYHRPVMSYERPIPPPPPMPFRYQMVPGFPRGLRPGYHLDFTEKNPTARMYNLQDLIEVEAKEEQMREERRRNPRPPRMVRGERATGFEDLVGTDPDNPYGMESWTSPVYDEDPPQVDDITDCPPYAEYEKFPDHYYKPYTNEHDMHRRLWDDMEASRTKQSWRDHVKPRKNLKPKPFNLSYQRKNC